LRYNPPEENNDEDDEPVYWEGRPKYIGEQTGFMRWSTEIEPKKDVINKDFMKDNKYLIMDIDKILALSFIDNPKSLKLFRLRRQLTILSKDASLDELAGETILANLADYQTTRGIRGNYQNALITQKREWLDKTKNQEKKGLFGRLVKARNDEEKMQDMNEVY